MKTLNTLPISTKSKFIDLIYSLDKQQRGPEELGLNLFRLIKN